MPPACGLSAGRRAGRHGISDSIRDSLDDYNFQITGIVSRISIFLMKYGFYRKFPDYVHAALITEIAYQPVSRVRPQSWPHGQPEHGHVLKHLVPQPADQANDHRASRTGITSHPNPSRALCDVPPLPRFPHKGVAPLEPVRAL